MMTDFICPVCRKPLEKEQRRLVCPQGHSFDMARQGYVNLLRSQQPKEKRHGDDRMMARARQLHFAGLSREAALKQILAEERARRFE